MTIKKVNASANLFLILNFVRVISCLKKENKRLRINCVIVFLKKTIDLFVLFTFDLIVSLWKL